MIFNLTTLFPRVVKLKTIYDGFTGGDSKGITCWVVFLHSLPTLRSPSPSNQTQTWKLSSEQQFSSSSTCTTVFVLTTW